MKPSGGLVIYSHCEPKWPPKVKGWNVPPLIEGWANGRGPLYRQLADSLARAIKRGHLPKGARLPSERQLARALSVSRTTVVTAYQVLRDAGLLESRRGSGTRVAVAISVGPPIPVTGTGSALLEESSNEVIDCSYSVMRSLAGFPEEVLGITGDDMRQLAHDFSYEPLGLSVLRAAIAERYTRSGLQTAPDEVIVTTGAQQAIALVFSMFSRDGGKIVLEDPTYVGALDAARVAGGVVVGVPITEKGLDPRALRAALDRSAARLTYLMPSCHNPTGAVIDRWRREEIASLAEDGRTVIVDDMALADLAFQDQPQTPLASFAKNGVIVTIGSLSKVFWSGLRVGWIRSPAALVERLARLKLVSDLGSSHLSQLVAARLLPSIDELAILRRQQLREHLDVLGELLRAEIPSWTWSRPAGGPSLWVRLPFGDAEAFSQVAYRHGVRILAGTRMSTSETLSSHIRISFIPEPGELAEAVSRLKRAWAAFETSADNERAPLEVTV
jgi:DNA-binding transcriptional MocR family regulator